MSKSIILALFGAIALASVCAQPALAQDKTKALKQLKKANEGAKARDHVFDGRKPPPNAVRANPVKKPSPVGLQIHSTRNSPGFKPAAPRMKTINVPSPNSNVNRATTTRTTTTAPIKKKN